MIQVYKTPKMLRRFYPGLVWDKPSENEIYLTFDDGPHPEVTPWVIDILRKYDAAATFFCVGENLAKYPEIQQNLVASGHQVANHTFNHLKGWEVGDDKYLENIDQCDSLIEKKNKLFRPPYGRIKRSQIRRLSQRDIVMWSHLSWDFDRSMNKSRSINALSSAEPGSILVFHDSMKSFPNLQKILEPILRVLTLRQLNFGLL